MSLFNTWNAKKQKRKSSRKIQTNEENFESLDDDFIEDLNYL